MVRFVSDVSNTLQIDVRQRLEGRGAYLHLRSVCVERALQRRALQRALRMARIDEAPQDLLSRMQAAVEKRFLDRLGLARRAGRVVVGSAATRRAMKEDQAGHVCVAIDSSEGGRHQLVSNCHRKEVSVSKCFDGARLARAVGTDYVSAIAITGEPFAGELADLSASLEELIQASGGRHE